MCFWVLRAARSIITILSFRILSRKCSRRVWMKSSIDICIPLMCSSIAAASGRQSLPSMDGHGLEPNTYWVDIVHFQFQSRPCLSMMITCEDSGHYISSGFLVDSAGHANQQPSRLWCVPVTKVSECFTKMSSGTLYYVCVCVCGRQQGKQCLYRGRRLMRRWFISAFTYKKLVNMVTIHTDMTLIVMPFWLSLQEQGVSQTLLCLLTRWEEIL